MKPKIIFEREYKKRKKRLIYGNSGKFNEGITQARSDLDFFFKILTYTLVFVFQIITLSTILRSWINNFLVIQETDFQKTNSIFKQKPKPLLIDFQQNCY